MLCLLLWTGLAAAQMRTVVVDAGRVAGPIRSLQGVNLGPLETDPALPDLTAAYKDLRIDAIRTHDFFGPTDIDSSPKDRGAGQVIFRDWSADPEKPDSYQFGPSDRIVKAIADTGASICFRLGRSFAANPTPPPDFDKFAAVSKHIVMHYNAGWANGFHFGIRYWEVWNEPNVEKTWVPNKGLYLFWSGTREQFFDLYEKTARVLKQYDPALKVGGPGLAEGARESPWREGFVRWCAERKTPLDFLTWHHYHSDSSDPYDMVRIARDARRILDTNGLKRTESHANEWNINLNKTNSGSQHQASMESAAFTTAALIYMQDAPVDRSYYYKGNAGNMGTFELDGTYRKKAYALKATGAMRDTPQRLRAEGGDTLGFAVLAGRSRDRKTVQVLIANYEILQPAEPPKQSAPAGSHGLSRRSGVKNSNNGGYALTIRNLPWGKREFKVRRYLTNSERNFAPSEETTARGGKFEITNPLPPPAIELIVLQAK